MAVVADHRDVDVHFGYKFQRKREHGGVLFGKRRTHPRGLFLWAARFRGSVSSGHVPYRRSVLVWHCAAIAPPFLLHGAGRQQKRTGDPRGRDEDHRDGTFL